MPANFRFTDAELQDVLVDLIRTGHIAQPLIACRIDDSAEAVIKLMRARGLNVVGVRDASGKLLGMVQQQDLQRDSIASCLQPLEAGQVIDAESPLLNLFERLQHRHWAFVQHGNEIDGFVSRSDLQRSPVRMLLFGLVSMFEVAMLEMIREHYSAEEVVERLNANRLGIARRLHASREQRGEELELTDCLQIADKRDLLLASRACIQELGFVSNNAAARFFVRVEQLRDRLVHANDLIAGSSWSEFLTTAIELARFLRHYAEHVAKE